MYNISIRYFIPALFALFALFEGGVAYYSGIRDAIELTKREALQEFRVDMTRQQEVIEMLLRSDRLGTLRLYIASMATNEEHLISLYVNSHGKVVSATDLSLVGTAVSDLRRVVADFDEAEVEQARKGNQGVFSYGEGKSENTLIGYFEICENERGFSAQDVGCGFFFHTREVTQKIERAKKLTLQHFYHNLVGILFVLLLMMLFFHFIFNRRVKVLIDVLKSISAGDETIRAHIRGRDELGSIANAFNVMLDRITDSKSKLEESQQALNITQQQIQSATERRLRFNEALVSLSQCSFETASDAAQQITRACVEVIGASQASIWKKSQDGSWLNCEDLYRADQQSHHRIDSVPYSEVAGIFSEVGQQGTLCFEDLSRIPPFLLKHRQDILSDEVQSLMITAVWTNGQHVGLLCCSDQKRQHDWQEDERHFVEGIAHRITQYKEVESRNQAEQALRQSEARLAEAQRIGRMGNWHWDFRSNELRWSDEIFRMIGLDPKTDTPSYDLFLSCIHPNDRELLEREINTSLLTGRDYLVEHRMVCVNGDELVVEEIGRVLYEGDEAIAMDGVVKDITGRKRDEDNLRKVFAQLSESEEKYRLIFELSEDPMWVLIGDKFVSVNQAAFKLLKYDSIEQLFNIHPSELSPEFQPDGESSFEKSNRMNRIAYERGHNRFEWMHRKADGEIFPVEVSLTRIIYEGQNGLFCLWRDLTDRKFLELQMSQQKEQAEAATRAKSEFLANMSHEIRTPMNAIINLSYLAQSQDLPTVTQDYLIKIERAGKNLLGILNDILDLSKVEAHKLEINPQPFNLYDLLNNLAVASDGHSHSSGVDLLFNIAEDVPYHLVGDALRLGQVLTNLLSNALKFTSQGEIVLSAERLPCEGKHLTLKFQVRDSGIGIKEEQQAQLFDSFSQADGSISRRYGGTGLGLTICKHLVEMMGGEITISSSYGEGSTFSFTCQLELDRTTQNHLTCYQDMNDLRVLVVDDNPSAQMITHKVLQRFSIESFVVENAAQAMQQLELVQHDPQLCYHLVIADWMMPNENGIQLSKRIRKKFDPAVCPKIILYSSYGIDLLREQVEDEIDGFVDKPFTPSTLLDEIIRVTEATYEDETSEKSPDVARVDYHEALAKSRVLVVDDNDINLEIVELLLDMMGVEVVTASSAQQAFEILESNPFDAILMDIQMPVMDGLEATRHLRKDSRFEDIPIIALTANAMHSDIEKSLQAGMNDHITKPIDPDALYQSLYVWILKTHNGESRGNISKREVEANDLPLGIELAGIDQQSGLHYLSGDLLKYHQLLKQFYDNYHSAITELPHIADQAEWPRLSRECHSIKGVSATLGAKKLSDAAAVVELDASQKRVEPLHMNVFIENMVAVFESIKQLPELTGDDSEVSSQLDRTQLLKTIEQLLVLSESDVSQALVLSESFTSQLAASYLRGEAQQCANLLNNFDIDAYKQALSQLAKLISGET